MAQMPTLLQRTDSGHLAPYCVMFCACTIVKETRCKATNHEGGYNKGATTQIAVHMMSENAGSFLNIRYLIEVIHQAR
jgi:hypothetical protein